LEAAAVDAAAASATAGALPLVTPGAQAITYHPSSMMMMGQNAAVPAAVNGGSSYGMSGIMGLGGMCGDASSMQLASAAANASRYAVAHGGSGYGLVGMTGQQQQVQQQMQQMQGSLVRDDMGSSYVSLAGSDPNLRIPGIAMPGQQQDTARSLSEPLPPMPEGMIHACNPSANAAWLQLAAASQLPASQIMSSIRPPTQMQQAAQQLMPGAGNPALNVALAHMSAAPGMLSMSSGGACSTAMEAGLTGADRLSSNLAGMSLVDDSSTGSSCLTALSGDHQYLAALNAAAAAAASGRPLDHGAALQSPPQNSSNLENFLLLQQLQAQQQQQLAKLGSTASTMSCGLSPASRQGSGSMYAAMASMQNGSVMAGQQMNGTWGMRLA
jgi:hypothetical protein